MININDLYQAVNGEVNTNQSGMVPPYLFDLIVYKVSIKMAKNKMRKAESSQEISDDIGNFLKSVNIMVTVPNGSNYGLIKYPNDYFYYMNSRIYVSEDSVTCPCATATMDDAMCEKFGDKDSQSKYVLTEFPMLKIDNSRWAGVLDHVRLKPTLKDPKITQFSDGFKVAPKQVSIVVLDYYRKPVRAHWGYVQVDDYFEYDPNTSVQLDWVETMFGEFVDAIKPIYMEVLRDPQGFEMSLKSAEIEA